MNTEAKQAPTTEWKFDEGSEMHRSDLYEHDCVAEAIDGLAGVTDAHVAQYREQGYLAVENAFTPDEIASGIAGLSHLIMGGNPQFKGIRFEAKAREILPTLDLNARQDAVRKLMDFVDYDERLKALSHHAQLLALVERIVGERPVMFQDMALLKPPYLGREKPWHQDHAYFDMPVGTAIVGVWIALDHATLENGCMRVLAGRHREGPVVHFKRRDWQICDTEIEERQGVVAAPLRPGGILLFDGLLPHGTPHNHSPSRRRALQFHYHNASARKWTKEERLAIFGSEGKDVEC